ncbi:MAG TPA: hypothetical protein VLV78_17065 [Thermoanaerobaculia bacterium]|nr:hypothetical protein [Thermoanaerobaculia bacterium]
MSEVQSVPYRSRKGGLIFFGLLELALGLLFLLMMLLIFVSAAYAPAQPAMPVSQMLASSSMYLVGGIILICLGIGSMLQRRWARDLSLVIGWFWLLLGVFMTITMAAIVPQFMPESPQMPAGARIFALTCMAMVMAIFGIAVPLALVLFYRSPNVRATCIAADPVPRWTERVPLPLLALSLWLAAGAIAVGASSIYGVLPLPGRIVTGAPAVMVYLAIGLFLLYVAWGMYMRDRLAWWMALAYGIVMAIYCVVVFPRIDAQAMTRAMHLPHTPGMPDIGSIYRSPWFFGFLAVIWVAYFGYLLFVRRYFVTAEAKA